ncbi:MAG: 4Fe-4S binding protein [Acidobacteriota bacterium]
MLDPPTHQGSDDSSRVEHQASTIKAWELPVIRPRARHFRILSQAAFLLAFLALFWGLAEPRVPATVASILLALDPLTAVGTLLSDWTIVGWTWLGLVVLALTAVLGRFFCGWVCPLGTLQHFVSWIAGPERRKRPKITRYRRWFSIKYIVLAVLLTWAVLGTDHIGWLDPIPLLHRAFAAGIRPIWHGGLSPGGWFSFGLLAASFS